MNCGSLIVGAWGDVPTWGLFAVGVATAWIALRTLRDIRKQTSNAEVTATAALESARAVVQSERAWIVVDASFVPGSPKVMLHTDMVQDVRQSVASIRLLFLNEGKTLAWIDEVFARFQIIKDLPQSPDRSVLELISEEPMLIGGQAPARSQSCDYILVADGHQLDAQASVVWGVVKYRDTFGQHETVFGFQIVGREKTIKRLPELPAYNALT